jgi:hypothetical protein
VEIKRKEGKEVGSVGCSKGREEVAAEAKKKKGERRRKGAVREK